MSRHVLALGLLLAVTESTQAQSVRVDVGRRPYYDYGHNAYGYQYGQHWRGPYGISIGGSRFGLNIDIGRRSPYGYGYGQAYDPYDAYYNYRDRYYDYGPAPRALDGAAPGTAVPGEEHAPLPSPQELERAQPGNALPAETARRPSTEEELAQSAHSQKQGDIWFRTHQNPRNAIPWYRQAIQQAPDRAESYFHLAIAEAAAGYYYPAVGNLRIGLALDPTWPVTGPTIAEFFGPENLTGRLAVTANVYNWARADIRDPDRLFLIGVFAHLNGYDEKAAEIFALALRLEERGDDAHIMAFLRPAQPVGPAAPANPGVPVEQAPRQPAPNTTPPADFIPEPPQAGEPAEQRIPQRRSVEPPPRPDTELNGPPSSPPAAEPKSEPAEAETVPASSPAPVEEATPQPAEAPTSPKPAGPVIPQPQPNT